MSREVRRVPADWKHPEGATLYGESYREAMEAWKIGRQLGYDDPEPEPEMYMPDWPEAERTHYQMYETTTEGSPVSPVMATPEALADWLFESGASAFGPMTATREEWLAMILGPGASVASMVYNSGTGEIRSGVAVAADEEAPLPPGITVARCA